MREPTKADEPTAYVSVPTMTTDGTCEPDLRHDIARHVAICSEQATRIAYLDLVIRAAFEALEDNNEAEAHLILKNAAFPKSTTVT